MSGLASRSCVPCRGGVPPLSVSDCEPLLAQVDAGWELVEGHHLKRIFSFSNFAEALAFVNHIGALAESENHHPDLELGWGRVQVIVYTHKIDGLTESDFVLAAKIDTL